MYTILEYIPTIISSIYFLEFISLLFMLVRLNKNKDVKIDIEFEQMDKITLDFYDVKMAQNYLTLDLESKFIATHKYIKENKFCRILLMIRFFIICITPFFGLDYIAMINYSLITNYKEKQVFKSKSTDKKIREEMDVQFELCLWHYRKKCIKRDKSLKKAPREQWLQMFSDKYLDEIVNKEKVGVVK